MYFALRLIVGAIGLGLIYQAFLLYETQEGAFANKLEDLWIKIDDLHKVAVAKHTAFVSVLAAFFSTILDRIFGKKLLSVQATCVSVCYAIASLGLTLLVIDLYFEGKLEGEESFVSMLIYCFTYGTIPALIPRSTGSVWIKIWTIGFVFLAYHYFVGPLIEASALLLSAGQTKLTLFILALIIVVALSAGLFTAFIAVIRKMISYVSSVDSTKKVIFVIILGCLPLITLYVLWKTFLLSLGMATLPTEEQAKSFNVGLGTGIYLAYFSTMICTMLMHLIFIPFTGCFILLAALMMLHRLFWPVLERPVYALQKLEGAKRSKLFGLIGFVLLLFASGKIEWFEKLVKLVW
jgi:hypothetical protein